MGLDVMGSSDAALFAMVLTTASNIEEARMLAQALVEARLAACVQILPMESVYRWNGAVEEAREWLLLGKIRVEDFAAAEAAIRMRHTYETPEITLVPIIRGSTAYLSWIAASTER